MVILYPIKEPWDIISTKYQDLLWIPTPCFHINPHTRHDGVYLIVVAPEAIHLPKLPVEVFLDSPLVEDGFLNLNPAPLAEALGKIGLVRDRIERAKSLKDREAQVARLNNEHPDHQPG